MNDSFVLLTYAILAALRTFLEQLIAWMNLTFDSGDQFSTFSRIMEAAQADENHGHECLAENHGDLFPTMEISFWNHYSCLKNETIFTTPIVIKQNDTQNCWELSSHSAPGFELDPLGKNPKQLPTYFGRPTAIHYLQDWLIKICLIHLIKYCLMSLFACNASVYSPVPNNRGNLNKRRGSYK